MSSAAAQLHNIIVVFYERIIFKELETMTRLSVKFTSGLVNSSSSSVEEDEKKKIIIKKNKPGPFINNSVFN